MRTSRIWRYCVRNICGYRQIEGDRLYATVDQL
jgi:hypothetical protein